MVHRAALLFAVAGLCGATQVGCDDGCVDEDGDGTGKGCASGPDCDDGDPTRAIDCESPPPDCNADSYAKGCPCLTGSSRDCYHGDPESLGIGACRAGRQQCLTGTWSACDGEVAPERESCNAEDDDCDGIPDEGALSPCGGCDPECTGGVWGAPADPFHAEGDLALTDAGELTLAFDALDSLAVWVPNAGDGTLSKIDAAEAREVARYRIAGAPERVAVDHHGDAWVVSPSPEARSQLAKVAGDASRCVDRDGDGVETSGGPNDVLPAGEDECVLLEIPIGDDAELARALAIDGTRTPDDTLGGNVWVAMQRGARVLELDGRSGEIVREVALAGLEPYASAFDPWGTLWLVDREGLLARIDPAGIQPSVVVIEAQLACYTLESIASDRTGVLTLGGASCESVALYEPRLDRWQAAKTPGVLTPRGVVALDDASWVAYASGALGRIERAPLAIDATFPLADTAIASITPVDSTAIGADSLGRLWVVSASGATRGRGVVTRFDLATERVDAQVVVGRLPGGQGDLTGAARLGTFAPQGSTTHVFEGCGLLEREDGDPIGPPSEWLNLHVAWTPGPGARVGIEARRALDRAALAAEPFVRLGELPSDTPPFALDFERGGVVEVRLTLAADDRLGAPRVARVGIEWRCPGPD